MRSPKYVVLAGILSLLTLSASAQISRISPSNFDLGAESFINIFGSNLTGTVETSVVFDGLYAVEPGIATSTQLNVFVPTEVMLQEGTHSLVVRAIDGAGVREYGPVTFTVTAPVVDNGPPLLNLPEIVVAEATSSEGTVVNYEASAYDADGSVPITCTPASGASFNFGYTNVQCSATNTSGTTNGSFYVLVSDTTPPVVTVPGNIVSESPVVTYSGQSAVDAIAGSVPVTCSPASGSTFPQGTTTVRCSATDPSANTGVGYFTVTVTGGPPALQLPDDITEEATGPGGAVVTFVVTSADNTPVTCTPASGSTFALGTTTVTCTATNNAGTSTGTFNVTVTDFTPPVITAPAVLYVEATSAAGATATYVATAHDLVDGDVPVTCTPTSGSFFAFGTTDVVCTATDSHFNGENYAFQVIVQDTTAPTVTSISASPNTLWPPNHQLVDITVSATLVDAVDPSPTWSILSVSSNQPTQGTGDGDQPVDWIITGNNTVKLRSERSSGVDRVYTITIQTKDATGNLGTATVNVYVTQSSSITTTPPPTTSKRRSVH
jgi:hypothetical protein